MSLYAENAATFSCVASSAAVSGEMSFTMICQFPFLFSWFEVSIRIAISAILNTAVTRNTARTMHKIVMRFCRLRTLAEIGIRLR